MPNLYAALCQALREQGKIQKIVLTILGEEWMEDNQVLDCEGNVSLGWPGVNAGVGEASPWCSRTRTKSFVAGAMGGIPQAGKAKGKTQGKKMLPKHCHLSLLSVNKSSTESQPSR